MLWSDFSSQKSQIFNQRGFTLVETLVAIALVGMMSLAYTQFRLDGNVLQKQANAEMAIRQTREILSSILEDEQAWLQTVQMAAKSGRGDMGCLLAKTDCRGHQGDFALYGNDGTLFYAGARAGAGFDREGKSCTFDPKSADTECFYAYDVSWSPMCDVTDPTLACENPQVRLQFNLWVKDKAFRYTFNESRYHFSLIRQRASSALVAVCEAMGGTLRGGVCALNYARPCAAGEYLGGLSATGDNLCVPFAMGQCAENHFVAGFDANGKVRCESAEKKEPLRVSVMAEVGCRSRWDGPMDVRGFAHQGGDRWVATHHWTHKCAKTRPMAVQVEVRIPAGQERVTATGVLAFPLPKGIKPTCTTQSGFLVPPLAAACTIVGVGI